MGGNAGDSYDVEFRVYGVIEAKTYVGGTNYGGYLNVGGAPAADVWNIYKIGVSSPSSEVFVNRGTSGGNSCYSVDYKFTMQIDAGAAVTFSAATIDTNEILHLISVAGVTDPPQPYRGQWLNVVPTKVTKR
jgi:hypothetical protein